MISSFLSAPLMQDIASQSALQQNDYKRQLLHTKDI